MKPLIFIISLCLTITQFVHADDKSAEAAKKEPSKVIKETKEVKETDDSKEVKETKVIKETKEPEHKFSERDLTPDERDILDRGEIGTTAYVLGGVLGTYPLGLGIGHAIQGRYSEKGWIFTVGELGSLLIAISGFTNDGGTIRVSGAATIGLLGFVGFRIWEIVDLWAAPPEHNRKLRRLKKRLGLPDDYDSELFIQPMNGRTLGLGLRVRF